LEKLKLNLLGEAKRKHFIKPAPALVKLHWYKPEKTEDRSQKTEVRSCRRSGVAECKALPQTKQKAKTLT
jgi:hypothetical protein